MVGARTHLGNLSSRSALELAILQHGKVYAAYGDSREINADTSIHRRWIGGVRHVPRLLSLDLVDILNRKLVAAVGTAWEG